MPSSTHARKEHRKLPFLKAFARIGTVARAAKASRISRDAVYDWRRNDPSFERAFQNAKRRHDNELFATVDSAVVFFKDVIRPIIPENLWPRVVAELAIASTNLKRDLKEGGCRNRAIPSGEMAEVSLSPRTVRDVAVQGRDNDTSTPM